MREQLVDSPSPPTIRAAQIAFDGINAQVRTNVVEFLKHGGIVDLPSQDISELYRAANLLRIDSLKVCNSYQRLRQPKHRCTVFRMFA